MLNLRRGLLLGQEKPDDSLHPMLLTTSLMNCSFIVSATVIASQRPSIKSVGGSSQNCAQHICMGRPDYWSSSRPAEQTGKASHGLHWLLATIWSTRQLPLDTALQRCRLVELSGGKLQV